MNIDSIDKHIQLWIDKNKRRIIKNIGKPYFYTDKDVRDFISRFPFDCNMDFVAKRLFVKLSSICFSTVVRKNLSMTVLKNEVYKSALFSTLNGYARQTFKDDLVNSFPFDECAKVLKR